MGYKIKLPFLALTGRNLNKIAKALEKLSKSSITVIISLQGVHVYLLYIYLDL